MVIQYIIDPPPRTEENDRGDNDSPSHHAPPPPFEASLNSKPLYRTVTTKTHLFPLYHSTKAYVITKKI